MKFTTLTVAAIIAGTPACADTYWHCKGDECLGVQEDHPSAGAPAVGTYDNPIQDVIGGDLSGPVHPGMYCVHGLWHQGYLRRGEHSPVIRPSCGSAVYQIPH